MGKISKKIREKIQQDLDQSFNEFIRFALDGLPEASPQWTGFFASSWTATRNRLSPSQGDFVRDYEPWAAIKKIKSGTLKSYPPYVSPRFDFKPNFKFGETVYIGNKTEYAKYALASPKSNLIPYIGQLGSVAKEVFRTQKGAGLRIAESSSSRIRYKAL